MVILTEIVSCVLFHEHPEREVVGTAGPSLLVDTERSNTHHCMLVTAEISQSLTEITFIR